MKLERNESYFDKCYKYNCTDQKGMSANINESNCKLKWGTICCGLREIY
jgi:hypothetical protein